MNRIKTETWILIAQSLDGGSCSKYVALYSIWSELNKPEIHQDSLTLIRGLLLSTKVNKEDLVNTELLSACRTKLSEIIKVS
ncbi:MAG: hypothetical protein R3321_03360 [Nitrososphaeraceae archaeon]|nr:hypothetical protein [Nitrososphaeraceae archaeon]